MCSNIHWQLNNHLRSPGSEIYVGCSNGQLLHFGLQADSPNQVSSMVWDRPPSSNGFPDRNPFHRWNAGVAFPKTHRRNYTSAMYRTYSGVFRSGIVKLNGFFITYLTLRSRRSTSLLHFAGAQHSANPTYTKCASCNRRPTGALATLPARADSNR